MAQQSRAGFKCTSGWSWPLNESQLRQYITSYNLRVLSSFFNYYYYSTANISNLSQLPWGKLDLTHWQLLHPSVNPGDVLFKINISDYLFPPPIQWLKEKLVNCSLYVWEAKIRHIYFFGFFIFRYIFKIITFSEKLLKALAEDRKMHIKALIILPSLKCAIALLLYSLAFSSFSLQFILIPSV